MSSDLEQPMGNAELRLTLQRIESAGEQTRITGEQTHEQAKKTNGTTRWTVKMIYLMLGALPLLASWAGWLTKETLDNRYTPANVQQWVAQGIEDGIKNANK